MVFTPPPPLTVERIREVARRYPEVERRIRGAARKGNRPAGFPRLPDLAAGETAEDVLAEQVAEIYGEDAGGIHRDWFRVQGLLSVLSRGTVEDEIARTASGVRARQLRLVRPESVQALLQSLDVLQPHLGVLVHAVRSRHAPESLAGGVTAAGARRTGDPRRPPLTEARIRRVLRVLADYAGRSPRIRAVLGEPMKLDETGAGARQVLGTRLAAAADRDAGGAEGLVRDLFWILLVRARTRGDRTVDSWLHEFEAARDPAAWTGGRPGQPRRTKRIAAAASGAAEEMVRLLRLVSREEEAAVVACRDEIDALLREVVPQTERPRLPE